MRGRIITGSAIAIALFLAAPPLLACPYCQSDIGREVAAGIFNDAFFYNAVRTLLPIPILLLIVGLIHFGIPYPGRPWRHRAADKATPAEHRRTLM